jgi:hypothetical protein
VGKVRDTVVLLVVPILPPGGALPENDTLCSGVGTNVHVTVPPGAMVTVAGENVSDAVAVTSAVMGFGPGWVTVTATWAVRPSEVAVIVDEPAATPVAVFDVPVVPDSDTFVASDEFHVTVRFKLPPCASFGCAEKATVPPTLTDCALDGFIVTLATAGGGGGGVPPPPPPPHPVTTTTAPTRRSTRISCSSATALERLGRDD